MTPPAQAPTPLDVAGPIQRREGSAMPRPPIASRLRPLKCPTLPWQINQGQAQTSLATLGWKGDRGSRNERYDLCALSSLFYNPST
jgi:hypothetical protein